MKLFKFILLLLSFSTLLQAKTFKGEIESSGNVGCQTLTQKESPYISSICVDKVKVKYKIYSMMGEPVEIYAVYWELSPYINLRTGSRLVSDMPMEVQEAYAKVTLHYNTKFIISLNQLYSYRASFRFSGGALKKSETGYSFDTPSSPSWDKFMLKNNSTNAYFSKKEAINIFKTIPENEAYFRFDKIGNLAFSNLYALNKTLKPKKEKPGKDKKKEEKQTKKEDALKQKSQTQQNINQKTNTTNMMSAFKTPQQSTQQSTNIQAPNHSPIINNQSLIQNTTYTNHNTVNASLLLLIDVSGSMQGAKLRSAKKLP